MRKSAIFAVLLLFVGCRSAPPPNLSGAWRPREAGAVALLVEHREPELKVRSGAVLYTYTTDSSETCNVVDGSMVCSRARWDGPFLQIDSTVKGEKGDTAQSERWSLSGDARTLTIQRSLPAARTTVAYERQ